MRKTQQGTIDPYGLGFIVIVIGALLGGVQDSDIDQQTTSPATTTNTTYEQETDHAFSK